MNSSAPSRGGFTLIELVTAVAILAVVCAGIATSVVAGMKMTSAVRERDVARQGAQSQIERVLVTPFDQLSTINATTFNVAELDPLVQGTPVGSIAVDSTDPLLPRVTVRVDWQGIDGTQSLELSVELAEGL